MNSIIKPFLFTAVIVSGHAAASHAESYVVVGKTAKIFDSPDAKGYVTLNSKNKEISVIPGMVLKSLENANGWHMIEYSPGLRAYVSELVTARGTLPSAGSYTVSNDSTSVLQVSFDKDIWKASARGKEYKGKVSGNAVLFYDTDNHKAYSLVTIGKDTVAVSYDNDVTAFF